MEIASVGASAAEALGHEAGEHGAAALLDDGPVTAHGIVKEIHSDCAASRKPHASRLRFLPACVRRGFGELPCSMLWALSQVG